MIIKKILYHFSLFLSFFFLFSSFAHADTIICPKDVSNRPSVSVDNLYLKCNGTTRYAAVCFKSSDVCSAIYDAQPLCGENETCQRIDASSPHDSPCIKCVPKIIISNKTAISGSVTITGDSTPDTLRISIKESGKSYSRSKDVSTGNSKLVGYIIEFDNTDEEYNKNFSISWTVTALKSGTSIGSNTGETFYISNKYGSTNFLDMSVKTNSAPDTRPDCPISGSNPDYYCNASRASGYPQDIEDTSYKCSGDLKCFKENPTRGGSTTTTYTNTCTTTGLGGNTWSCLAPANCTSGVYYASSTNPALYACPADKPQYCCKISGTGGTATLAPGAPKVLNYERSCSSTGQISYKFNFTPGSGATYHKLQYIGVPLGDMTPPIDQYNNYTSGQIIPPAGGNGFSPNIRVNYDILACNSTGCTPDPNHWWSIDNTGSTCSPGGSTTPSSEPCSANGGIKSGTVAEGVCDKKVYNAADAVKPQATNPYYGKIYELRYTCSNTGTYDYINPDTTKCNSKPWFDPPSGTTPPAGEEVCDPNNPVEGCRCTSGACTATYSPIFSNWGCFTTGFDSQARCCPNGARYTCSYGKCGSNAAACTTSGGSTPGGTTGTLICYKDADGDGYGSSSGGTQTNQTSCASGWSQSNNDCYDQNPSANPGQTGDFYVHRGDGSFDYNCNGQNDKKYAVNSFSSSSTGTCLSTMPSGTVGFTSSQECGTSGTFRLCYKFADTACGTTAQSIGVSDTIGQSCPAGSSGNGWALVDAASVPQNCK